MTIHPIQKTVCLAAALLFAFLCLPAAGEGSVLDAYNSETVTIGILTGATAMGAVEARFPNAKIQHFSLDTDGYLAVASGKINAYAHDTILLKYACAENRSIKLVDEVFGETEVAVGISKSRADLTAPVNAFIKELIESGTRDDMLKRWILDADTAMPELPAPESPDKTLRVGTSGVVMPMTYYGADSALTGFDIEMLRRMGLQMNANVEISVMNYDALVAGLESGKLDLVVANLNITPERAERIIYSDPYMVTATGLVIKNDQTGRLPTTLSDLQGMFSAGKRLGVLVGSVQDEATQTLFPDATRVYSSTISDLGMLLNTGKIDGFLADVPQGEMLCRADAQLWMPDILVQEMNYGLAMAFGREELCAKIDAILKRMEADGSLAKMSEKWSQTDEALRVMPEFNLTGENGTLTLATDTDTAPFSYVRNGEVVGYDIELVQTICAELGYNLEITVSKFAGVLAAISSGKADIAACCITITQERKEQMLFTYPTYRSGIKMVLPASLKGAAADGETGLRALWTNICASFERTFIRESRWKLIVQGLWTTLVISVFSALLGTLLGFLVCMARRSRFSVLKTVAQVFVQIMQGTPIVVFLMILYYVVFGDVDPVFVAIVGFALNFAAYVSEMMRTGIEAVDKGQIEAASAIGFTRVSAFLLVTLPQAAQHFLPVFRGEFISLVKMTSVVGYITIMDLTKMSDIIRSRTYEAFFPLIATAIIYFLLSFGLAQGLSAIETRIDPKRKKRVVKGVREEA